MEQKYQEKKGKMYNENYDKINKKANKRKMKKKKSN